MANNKISVIIDVAVDRANQSLKSFRQSVAEAEGATGKFKAGAGAAMDSIKANAGNLALAGGAALITFGAKSVAAFQETALAAGQLRDSLGLTAEESSRYAEVAGDLGIGVETLEKSIGRMNRVAADTPEALQEIGAELVKNADGTTNVNETFLSTVDALNKIPDAARRSAAAQKIFGRSWMDMAELIGLGADGVRKALDSVEDGKVIDDKEVERARKFRDTLDNLKGTVEELTVSIGGAIVPALSDLAAGLKLVADGAKLIDDIGGVDIFGGPREFLKFGPAWDNGPGRILKEVTNYDEKQNDKIRDLADSVMEALAPTEIWGTVVEDAASGVDDLTGETDDATEATDDFAEAVAEARSQWDQLLGRISVSDAFRSVQSGFDEIETAALEAWNAAATGAADAEVKARDYEQKIDDMTRAVVEDFIPALGSVPAEVTSSIVAMIDEGSFAEAERRMAMLTSARNAIINVYARGGDPRLQIGARASGGPVSPGGTYLVGEQGPELLQMGSTGGNVVNASKTAAALSGAGGGPVNNTYNFHIVSNDPDAVVRAIREHVKHNGPIQGIT